MNTSRCIICNNQKKTTLFTTSDYLTGDFFNVSRCSNCGTILTEFNDALALSKYYPPLYFGKRRSFINYAVIFGRVSAISKLIRLEEKKILDIGCGNGDFLTAVKKYGSYVYGNETSTVRCREAQLRELDICCDQLKNCHYPSASFDLITLWHVLEHLVNPQEEINRIFGLLKNGGHLVISVPNISSWQARLTKGRWFHLDAPRHLIHFNDQTLTSFLENNHFKIVKRSQWSFIFELYGWWQSLLNLFCFRPNFLFDLLNGKIASSQIRSSKIFVALLINIILALPLLIFALVLSFLTPLFHAGSTITYYAQR